MDLNWTDEQYEQYEGQDLILGTGVPGSKWSGILKAINVTDEVINMSNDAIECKHGLTFYHTYLFAVFIIYLFQFVISPIMIFLSS